MCSLSLAERGLLATIFMAFIVWLLLLVAAMAATDNCGLIRDHDKRQFCYAVRNHDENDCNLIGDDDNRHFCQTLAHGPVH